MSIKHELVALARERRVRQIFVVLLLASICYLLLWTWCASTQSMALLAYTYTLGFNLLSLLTCVLSVWVERQPPSSIFSFGYERFEVLAVFASTVLSQLASLFIIKESIERLVLGQPDIHTGRLLFGACVAFFSNLVVVYGINNPALDHVISASPSSWVQEHVSDISQSICSVIPPLSSLLLPRVNPMLLITLVGSISILITHLLIEMRNSYIVDTFAAIIIALMMCATMLPLMVYCGKILLQTTPSHIVGQLDKCLRETLTIDGVLEFKHEHFWTLSFGKLAGSLQVRVRRDANEQLVLAHVVDRLSSIVPVLTVQVIKEEWPLRKTAPSVNITASVPILSPLQDNVVIMNGLHSKNYGAIKSKSGQSASSSVTNMLPSLVSSHSSFSSMNNINGSSSSSVKTTPSQTSIISSVASSSSSFPNLPMSENWFSMSNHNISSSNSLPISKNMFHSHISLTSDSSSKSAISANNNLLLTGTQTLEAENFTYHPR